MPRPRTKLDSTPESLNALLQQLHNQAEELRLNAMRDYREIKTLTNAGDANARVVNTVNLETARNNALRSAREAVSQRADLAKIQAGVMVALRKAESTGTEEGGGGEKLGDDVQAQLRAMARELRKEGNP